MTVNSKKVKKLILTNLPFLIFGYAGDMIACAYRTAVGSNFSE